MRGSHLICMASGFLLGCYGSYAITGSPDGSVGPDVEPDASHDALLDPGVEPTDAGADDPPTSCGNGTLDPGEECDDGNDVNSDACLNSCHEALCGDGVRWQGHEECDGADLGGATCASIDPLYEAGVLSCDACVFDESGCIARCGNGALDPGEECDDGNDVMWDGCAECAVVEVQVNVAVDGDQMYPDVALREGGFVVVWQSESAGAFDVVGRRYGPTGLPIGGELMISQSPERDQIHAAVAMNTAGLFVVAWQSLGQDGDGWGIFARRFAADGTPLGAEFQVNEHTADDQTKVDVAVDGEGGFFVAWESDEQDGSDLGVFARRYDPDGTALGGEFQINVHARYSQSDCAVAMAPDGRVAVAWESFMQDGSGEGIYAGLYDADGSIVLSEFLVNTWITRSQATPAVAMAPDGRFLVVWKSESQDGDGWGVFGQEFGDRGLFAGEEFRVNTVTANNQTHPNVAVSAGGRRIIAWSSMHADGSGLGVYGQRFVEPGIPGGGEFRSNTFTPDDQWVGALAMKPDGAFLVVWSSYGMDGSGAGVFSQRYGASGRALGASGW